MNLSIATDWQVWDDTEAVQLETAQRGSNQLDVIPSALRFATQERELSPSGGVYAAYDLVWCVPASLLAPGWSIKPGDVIQDSGANRWTILRADLNAVGMFWQCQTRNLILAYQLTDRVSIERASLSYSPAGVAVKTFPPNGGSVVYPNVPARLQLLTQEIADARGIRGTEGTYACIVGRQVAVTCEDRLNLAGVYYDILGLHNPQRIDELPVIECRKKV